MEESSHATGEIASILAGGDGSRKSRKRRNSRSMRMGGVYDIGEHSVEYWRKKHNLDVQIMASGGHMDGGTRYAKYQIPELNRHAYYGGNDKVVRCRNQRTVLSRLYWSYRKLQRM